LVEALLHLDKRCEMIRELVKGEDGRVQAIYISELGEEVGKLSSGGTGTLSAVLERTEEEFVGEMKGSMSIDGMLTKHNGYHNMEGRSTRSFGEKHGTVICTMGCKDEHRMAGLWGVRDLTGQDG
jgi:hypothetical protein